MPRRIARTLLFIAMVTFIAVFAVTEVMAQTCPEPSESCSTPDGWTISLVDGPRSDGLCSEGSYLYTYQVCMPGTGGDGQPGCDTKGLGHVNMALPDCCPNKIDLGQVGQDTLQEYPVGDGDPTTYFERGDQFVKVAKFTLNKADALWSFCAGTDVTDSTSVCLKVKNELTCCKILAPACLPPPNQPNFSAQTFTQSGYTFRILYDSAGRSYDVECLEGSCTVESVNIKNIKLYLKDEPIATVTWLPYDTPVQSAASPGCTYVRTRSGAVKQICD